MKEVRFTLTNRVIFVKINNFETGQYKGYVDTEVLRPSNRKSTANDNQIVQTISYMLETEFVSDLQFLVDRINARGSMSPFNLTQAFRDSIIRHINGCGRLIIGDLNTYIDCALHILKAYDGNILVSETSKKEMFEHYLDKIVSEFKDYIYIVKPWGLVKYS
jgi:hypothetical protein